VSRVVAKERANEWLEKEEEKDEEGGAVGGEGVRLEEVR
jgi:hypothetical protein